MRKILFIMFLGILSLWFVGCGQTQTNSNNTLEAIKQKGVVTIGVFSDKPPFGFINKDGKNDGFDVYLSKQIAKDLLGDENKVKFELVEAASRVEFLKSGKVDIIMANFTKTPEREAVVDFAAPYMKVALGVVSKNGEIKTIEDLKGKKLIVNKGTTADFYFSKNHPEIELLKYDQNTESFLALKDGRGVALAHDNLLVFAWAKENPGFEVGITKMGNEDVIAPAVKKGDKELLEWLNQEIQTLTENGFMNKAYQETLAPIYGEDNLKSVLFVK
ncbi:cysteine ABC transporter substrate-binding protein [Helicobacter pullorum]|mgnify:CR=1 FL=1|uniref:ABC transporter substrate-binding protein n=2 Tax=Helicobacter pullorum TaxID=35818 RepID=A0A0N0LTC4_9HELI|nr:cysteine ABC transporter substrate-binding protein [Helicobacter pullorum]HIS09607.1 cysteine ABC transporter substrate-binding protein [Candidatus Scatomorpha intestinipullorum]EEQ64142.1 ABC transporter, substrate-binding protein, family 3 [Helicobacter pullorum MIT 98-5489]KAB0575453.1 transporter substrate-binding domain-containing protein [Helicobacter pullorum NCTC 12824]KPH52436.1 ABC transporter substrate-binding protein [Helicobacter pullorum]KPH55049.1 ABC transporter substrate-bi